MLDAFYSSFVLATSDFIENSVLTIKDIASDCGEKITDGLAVGFKAFTGENKYIEAQKALTDLQAQAEKAQSDFNESAMKIQDEISSHLNEINLIRQKLQNKDFTRFLRLTSLFSQWVIEKDLIEEIFQLEHKEMNVKLSKHELFSIDFDNESFKTNMQAIFTLGFYTRKKANETLCRVKDQQALLGEEIKKLDAEKMRLGYVCSGLKEIVDYFKDAHNLYAGLLEELEYSVHLLKSLYLAKDMTYFDDKVDIYFLPERHLLCLMGAEKMTRILYHMGSYKYFDSEKAEIDDNDLKKLKEGHELGHNICQRIAA